ncbi:hypothetical protein M5D96_002736, partial [Drosophila gunungcola]
MHLSHLWLEPSGGRSSTSRLPSAGCWPSTVDVDHRMLAVCPCRLPSTWDNWPNIKSTTAGLRSGRQCGCCLNRHWNSQGKALGLNCLDS